MNLDSGYAYDPNPNPATCLALVCHAYPLGLWQTCSNLIVVSIATAY